MTSTIQSSIYTNCEVCDKSYLVDLKWPYVICKNCAEGLDGNYKSVKIDVEAATKIQSHADKTNTNQDFKSRVQSAAAKNENELFVKKCEYCGDSYTVHRIENKKYINCCIKCKLGFLKDIDENKRRCDECKEQYNRTGNLMYGCWDCIIRLNGAE
ncbi:hypothetical protein ACSAZL_12180 [Methanosarcina sp. T3]|uniref:hypothetical protein n=1 Tax=Methanosarcina sp. T3 TaxID=3439062 RepID=UPI003F8346D6